jgi:hypothetical protein
VYSVQSGVCRSNPERSDRCLNGYRGDIVGRINSHHQKASTSDCKPIEGLSELDATLNSELWRQKRGQCVDCRRSRVG